MNLIYIPEGHLSTQVLLKENLWVKLQETQTLEVTVGESNPNPVNFNLWHIIRIFFYNDIFYDNKKYKKYLYLTKLTISYT